VRLIVGERGRVCLGAQGGGGWERWFGGGGVVLCGRTVCKTRQRASACSRAPT
jgi:hypothetical protein